MLVADVPFEESAPFRAAAARHGIAPIFICPPNADDDLLRIASHGRGYTYLLSRAGVTGTESRAQLPLHHTGEQAARVSRRAAAAGFRHLEPEQVKAALQAGAAGAISGSAIVKIIEQHHANPAEMLTKLAAFASEYGAPPGREPLSERPAGARFNSLFPSKFVPFIYSKNLNKLRSCLTMNFVRYAFLRFIWGMRSLRRKTVAISTITLHGGNL